MLSVVREILSTPALLVGFIVLLGLLLQKKPVDHVIKGTVTAVIGFVLLTAGSSMLQNGALKDFGVLFNYDFQLQGIIPNMEAVSSVGITRYATLVSLMMVSGMVANVVMARFGPFPYIFLTGHHTLYMACLLTVVLYAGGMREWQIWIAGSLLMGVLMAAIPALVQKEMEKVTGSNAIALGHFSVIGYLAAIKTARIFTRDKKKPIKSTEEISFPAKLGFMRDSTVGIFIVMTIIFLFLTGIAALRTDLTRLAISYGTGSYQNWIIYAVMQGAQFSASIYVILAGVRLIIAEIVPAFKGIARKIVPDAKPAVDCPVLFNYAPNAVMIGFIMSFLGGVFAMAVMIGINEWIGKQIVPIIVPGVVAHFFCGGSAGVLCNAQGGVKGCLLGSFVHGILISLLSLAVMPVVGSMNLSGTTFSDSDFCVVGVLVGNLIKFVPKNAIVAIFIIVFLIPIIAAQIANAKNRQ